MHAVVEQFSGPHDYFNSPIWYNELGNAVTYNNPVAYFLAEGMNYANVFLVSPIVAVSAIPESLYGVVNTRR